MSDDVEILNAARAAFKAGAFRACSDRVETLACRELADGAHLPAAQLMAQAWACDGLVSVLLQRRFLETASAQQLAEAGTLLSGIGRHDEAVAMLDRAVARDGAHAPSLYFRGTLAMFSGDMEGARVLLERAIAADPRFAQSHWVLSMLPLAPDAQRAQRARAGLANALRGYSAEIYFGFALFNELHALGHHDEAWPILEAACAAKRRQLRYSPERQRALFDALLAWRPRPPLAMSAEARGDFRPVFIVGMHRSGTTLLESLLAAHPGVADGGESYAFTVEAKYLLDRQWDGVLDHEAARQLGVAAPEAFRQLARRYRRRNAWRAAGRPVLTEKLPSNVLALGPIAEALPEALFLHVRRDPVETCFSNLRTLFSTACGYSYDVAELAAYYRGYERLMAHWRACYGARILDIDFGDLTGTPDVVMRGVEDFLRLAHGLGGASSAPGPSRPVTSASAVQVRAKVSPRGQVARHYPAFVESLRRGGVG